MALVIDYKSGKRVGLATRWRAGSRRTASRRRSTCSRCEKLLGKRAAGGVYVALGGEDPRPRGMVAKERGRARLGLVGQRPARRGGSRRSSTGRASAIRETAAAIRAASSSAKPDSLRLAAAAAPTRRSAGASGDGSPPSSSAAVDRRDGSLLVRAGAGTGKTTVLVERFVRAVVDDGVAVERMLAITFTEKAAAEMRGRVRARFLELGRRDEARAAEGASISTIHGFCARLLRTHALTAGIDPDYRVLDEARARALAADAFDGALGDFLADATPTGSSWWPPTPPTGWRHGAHRLLAPAQPRRAPAPRRRARRERRPPRCAARRRAAAELGAAGRARRARRSPGGCGARHPGRDGSRASSGRRRPLCVDAAARAQYAAAARRCSSTSTRLSPSLRARYKAARRSRARLRGPRAAGARPARRRRGAARAVRGALRARAGRRVPGREPAPERADRAARRATTCSGSATRTSRSTASATRTWSVFRGHREEAAGRRARGERDGQLPLRAASCSMRSTLPSSGLWGDGYEPLARSAPGARERAAGRALRGPARGGHATQGRWDEALARRASRSAPRMAGVRPGAPPRRGCSRSGSTSSRASGPTSYRDVVMLLARHHRAWVYERALVERGIPTHVVGRPRLLEPAAGGRPAPLAGGAREPARRAGALLGARLAARRRCRSTPSR